MKKYFYLFAIFLMLSGLTACKTEKEPLQSVQITEGPFTFGIPENFIKDEEKSGESVIRYCSDVYEEASYVQYENSTEVKKLQEISEEKLKEQTDRALKEKYLTNTKSEVLDFVVEENEESTLLRYTLSYNLYSAIVTHSHIYYEKGERLHHLEYYDVEEEGYRSSFEKYLFDIIIE